jgi:solute carrier family 25 citrate transporter 1
MQGQQASKYKNTIDCAKQIFKEEGIKGLYKGTLPRLGRVVPGQGIIFMSVETIQDTVEKMLF